AITAEQRRWLETERVADFHEIELRIVAPPRGKSSGTDSFLAQVVFPPAMSLAEAKAYIFGEFEEAPARAQSSTSHWEVAPACLRVQLAEPSLASERVMSVQLSDGVRELITLSGDREQPGLDWHTDSLVFERKAGWDRVGAEAWTERHLGLVDLGRTAVLN